MLSYNDSDLLVPVEQVMAMMLVKAKETAVKANNNIAVGDAVLAVPHWFTDAQRRGVLNACEIASLPCLKLTNESNAIALSYGIFKSAKSLFSPTEPTHMMFIDLGYTGYCVTIVDFIQENMRVLSTVCDRSLGGRDFDDIIIEFLAETFQKKTGLNVRQDKKAVLKLQAGAEKAKKTLSPNGVNEANVSVECLANDKDLSVVLTRLEFERRAEPLVERLAGPIHRCLREAGLTARQLTEVELVGGNSRVTCVKRALGEILGLDPAAMNYGLKTTMNSDEAVARGSALQCAMLSSRMKVKPFTIIDKLPYGIVAHYEHDARASAASAADAEGETKEDVSAGASSAALYTRNDDVPHKPRRLTFRKKSADFSITLSYDDASVEDLPRGEDRVIGRYVIRIPPALVANGANDVRVTFALDKHSCVYIQSAQMMEEVAVEETKEAEGKDAKVEEKKDGAEGAPAVASTEVAGPPKKKFHKVDLEISAEIFGLSRDDVKRALELEASMSYEDQLIIETSDKRNELEAYVYSTRDKLDGPLKEFAKQSEAEALKHAMASVEDWLYEDQFGLTKQQYGRRLDDLRSLGNPIEARATEFHNRPQAIQSLKTQIELCRTFANNRDEAHDHITEKDRQDIRAAVSTAESWVWDMQSNQGDLPKHSNPVLTCDMISKKRNELFGVTNPIMIRPKPKPVPVPVPAPEAKAEAKPEGTPSGEQDKSAPDAAPAKEEEAPMDTGV